VTSQSENDVPQRIARDIITAIKHSLR